MAALIECNTPSAVSSDHHEWVEICYGDSWAKRCHKHIIRTSSSLVIGHYWTYTATCVHSQYISLLKFQWWRGNIHSQWLVRHPSDSGSGCIQTHQEPHIDVLSWIEPQSLVLLWMWRLSRATLPNPACTSQAGTCCVVTGWWTWKLWLFAVAVL